MENRKLMLWIMVSGAVAVALGAFGAHGLRPYLDETGLQNFQTANRYQFYHTLLAALFLIWKPGDPLLRKGALWALAGILLFSGSLYLLSLRNTLDIPSSIGILTPLGGICFILAWSAGILKLFKS
ncbi:MAG: DUF423 domain-containing protein [Saprospiraceae bacterium]|nr:DUF423 domain-containing protein [Saprospiraceae bacterium]